MGMFDEIIVSEDVLKEQNIKCPECGKILPSKFQTKCLDSTMDEYVLKRADNLNVVKLYSLGPPDEKYWKEYTSEEIESINGEYSNSAWSNFFQKKPGDGYYLPEAYFPENRRHRDMGELPHMILKMYTSCECKQFVHVNLKFTDGIVLDIKTVIPEWNNLDAKSVICGEENEK